MTGLIPLFNGLPIFGPAPIVRARAEPMARTFRGFSGLHGLVTKRSGTRGARADASGPLVGWTREDLAAAEEVFENFKLLGDAYTLFDSLGRSWPLMILVEFDPIGMVIQDESGFLREYRATFVGLSHPFV